MNKPTVKQSGFSVVEVIIVVAVLALIGFLGWRLMTGQSESTKTSSNDNTQQTEAPAVKSKDDLKDAEEYLSNKDIDNTLDTSEIDAALTE